MSQKPSNPKLWDMVIAQAKAKYSTYPNPAASHWVHERYVQSGGKFIDSNDPAEQQKKLNEKQFANRKKEKLERLEKTHKKSKDEKKKQ